MEYSHASAAHLILGEIQLVTSSMRVNSRWQTRGSYDSNLMKGFAHLQTRLKSPDFNLEDISYLKPFLNVIRSEETSGPITGVALTSIEKFLRYGFISPHSQGAAHALTNITDTATHCRFEASDPESDEVVLMEIMRVLSACVQSTSGHLLTAEAVDNIVQTGYRMCMQSRLSALLRTNAEHMMMDIIQTLFLRRSGDVAQSKVEQANADVEEEMGPVEFQQMVDGDPDSVLTPRQPFALGRVARHGSDGAISSPRSPSSSMRHATPPNSGDGSPASSPRTIDDSSRREKEAKPYIGPKGVTFSREMDGSPPEPYNSGTLTHLFQFFVELVNPYATTTAERRDGPAARVALGLRLVNTLTEVDGLLDVIPGSLSTIKTRLCFYLLQIMETDNLNILCLCLRVAFNVFERYKEPLKAQFEVFFNVLLFRILNDPEASYNKSELALELLSEFCDDPNFMIDMYVNFDCDIHCSNLFENLYTFLYKNAFPSGGGALHGIQLLSLDCLLSVIHAISNRCGLGSSHEVSGVSTEVLKRKKIKKTLRKGVELWNADESEGIQFLQQCKLLSTPVDPTSMAMFLRNTPGIDKAQVGEVIGKEKEENQAILKAFTNLFDFANLTLLESQREFMGTFRIPGEAQMISRILEVFAARYHECNPDVYHDEDACFLLAFAMVLLNVDLHHDSVPKKMTMEQFIRNLKGSNGPGDFPQDSLKEFYLSIQDMAFCLEEPYDGSEITASIYQNVLKRSRRVASYIASESSAYGRDMFEIIRTPIIASISVVFETSQDTNTVEKAISGFRLCAKAAAYYRLTEVFDKLIIALCKFSTLNSLPTHKPLIFFGSNFKAKLASKALFDIALEYGDNLRDSWRWVVSCIINMQRLELIPTPLVEFHSPLSKVPAISPTSQRKIEQVASGGLMSVFSWFDAGEDPPTEEELAAERSTTECISKLPLHELVQRSRHLQADSLVYLVKALILASVKPRKDNSRGDREHSGSGGSGRGSSSGGTGEFDESMALFCLDLLTQIALLNKGRVVFLWVLLHEHFDGLLSAPSGGGGGDAMRAPPTFTAVVDRAVDDLFALCLYLFYSPDLFDQLESSLNIFLSMDGGLQAVVAEKILEGLERLIEKEPRVATSPITRNTLLRFSPLFSGVPTTSVQGFQLWQNTYLEVSKGEKLPPLMSPRRLPVVDATPIEAFREDRASFFVLYDSCHAYCRSRAGAQVWKAAMDTLYVLFKHIPAMVEADEDIKNPGEAWEMYWLPALRRFCSLCVHEKMEVRGHALPCLQRAMLSGVMQLSSPLWVRCIDEVFFPLIDQLLQQRPSSRKDAEGMEQTMLRASALLSKMFLQNLMFISSQAEFPSLWVRVLEFIEKFMKAGSPLLAEAVPESLKNILLVMHASGILVPPSRSRSSSTTAATATSDGDGAPSDEAATKDSSKDGDEDGAPPRDTSAPDATSGDRGGEANVVDPSIWNTTWDHINTFCPELMGELRLGGGGR